MTAQQPVNDPETSGPAAPHGAKPRAEALWVAGLVISVLGLLVSSLGGAGLPSRAIGLLGLVLGVVAAVSAAKAGARRPVGPVLTVLAALFTTIVGGHPKEPRTILLAEAPHLLTEDEGTLDGPAGRVGPTGAPQHVEIMSHPGPLAIALGSLLPLVAGSLQPSALVAAEWDGAWFAGKVLSAAGGTARVHFLGWESEWDENVPLARLRTLSQSQLPAQTTSAATQALGSPSPEPCALTVAVYQPPTGLPDGADTSTLAPSATLYSERLDVADVAVGSALPGVVAGKAFALTASGPLRFDAPGAYFFGVASDGSAKLSIDGKVVSGSEPVALSAGVHQVRLDYRHDAGPKMTLNLRMGTDPKALKVLDTRRHGVAQVVRETDGSLRVVLFEGVLFDLDKDELNASAEQALSSINATTLARHPTAQVKVEGHTDDQGTDAYNLDLSRRRAERVKAWLVPHGRSEGSVSAEGFGEKRPRVPNDSAANRRANRRVELVIGRSGPSAQPANSTPEPAAAPNQATIDLLHAYYRDLNAATFEATRYFEPSVERYITFMNTNAAAMNHYIRDVFPKQFHEAHFALEEGSLVAEGPGQFVYIEQSHYVVAGHKQASDKRVRVRIRLSPRGKIVFLQQFKLS